MIEKQQWKPKTILLSIGEISSNRNPKKVVKNGSMDKRLHWGDQGTYQRI